MTGRVVDRREEEKDEQREEKLVLPAEEAGRSGSVADFPPSGPQASNVFPTYNLWAQT